MSRQVDVKALVSHIVRGDGTDKCRICMGDTSEGQVFLGDTVLLDGNRPVTLAELLETITGVEMPTEAPLPQSACAACAGAASAAGVFRNHCLEAARHWNQISEQLTLITHVEWKPGPLYLNLLDDNTFEAFQVKKANNSEPLKAFNTKLKQKRRIQKAKLKENQDSPSDITCPDCETRLGSHKDLNYHLKYTDWRCCFVCGEIVKLNDLKEHLLVRHKKASCVCNICSEIFSHKLKLEAHRRTAHRRSHYCIECKRSFRNAHSLTAHKYVHERRECNGCAKLFTNRNCYVKHVKRCQKYVKEIAQYKCDYCGKSYNKKDRLRMHIMLIHVRGRMFQCHVCSKEFFSEPHLNEHCLIHDKVPDRFPCEFCDNKYSTRRGFEKHTRKHFKENAMAKEYLKLKKNGHVFIVGKQLNRY